MAIGLAQPAYAAGNAPVPEPGMLGLLAMAVTGVVVGRRLASKKPPGE